MDFRFYRCEPDAPVNYPEQPGDSDTSLSIVLVLFERCNDPDALNHMGCDFYGAYGNGELIDQWAEGQPLEVIARDQLPEQLTWFPSPFSDPEA